MSSNLPADLFTPTEGSTMLLDGFPDTQYNEGVLHQWDSATVRGLSGLPDGVIGGDPGWEKQAVDFYGRDLPDELTGDESAGLSDLTWLDLAGLRGQGDAPDESHYGVVEDLKEAWGVNRRTTGLNLIPSVEKDEADYRASLAEPSRKAAIPKQQFESAIARAWRQVTANIPLKTVGIELAKALGDHAHRAKTAFDRMRAEVGLVGPVYIRADAYPKCATGEWTNEVRKKAGLAAFVVSKPDCSGCVMAQAGRCAAFGGRKLVAAVPYSEAVSIYSSRIASAGLPVPTGKGLHLKDALRKALHQAQAHQASHGETLFPVMPDAALSVTRSAAKAALHNARGPAPVKDPTVVQHERAMKVAQTQIARYVRSGLLDRADAEHLVQTVLNPAEMIQRAAAIVARPVKASTYTSAMPQDEGDRAIRALRQAGVVYDPLQDPQDAAFARSVGAAHQRIAHYVQQGWLSASVADALRKSKAHPVDMLRRAAVAITTSVQAGEYHYSLPQFEGDLSAKMLKQAGVSYDPLQDPQEATHTRSLAAARDRIDTYVVRKQLTAAEAKHLVERIQDPRQLLRMAAAAITAPRDPATYQSTLIALEKDQGIRAMVAAGKGSHQIDRAPAIARVQALIRKKMASGEIQESDGKRLLASTADPEAVERALSGAMVPSLMSKSVISDKHAAVKRDYQGARFEVAQPAARVASASPQETDRYARWLRVKMTEGATGLALDQMASARFSPSVRTAATNVVGSLRQAHEGLSGFVYVDAAAYATANGVQGCERGALQHRANTIPTVLAMPKCGSCVNHTKLADGTSTCSLYSKPLIKIASEVLDDPAAYRKDMIRFANAPDHERVANLFAPSYDASDFNLGQETDLDHIEMSDLPDSDELGAVLFGGIQID